MQRRDFLRSLVGGVAVVAAARTFPFRVFSFPTQPKLLTKEAASYITKVLGSNQFEVGDMVWMHPDQARAFERLQYKITKIDQQERTIEFENIRQSRHNWQNLSRSPEPFRVGVT